MDDELVEINSDKATLAVTAEDDGVLKILKLEGEVVNVGDVIGTIDTSAAPSEKKAETKEAAAPAAEPVAETAAGGGDSGYAKGVPSVSAEKLLKEKGVAAADVAGTGRGGRVTKTDVVNHKPAEKAPADSGKKKEAPKTVVPAFTGTRNERREKMSFLRRKIADRLVSVKNDTAMLTTFNEVDMSAIMDLRKQYKEKFKEFHGVGLGFMSFFTKAVTEAAKHFPAVNAQIEGQDAVFFDYVDVSIAVSSPRGLVVPVLRNAESMSFAEVEGKIMELALKARDGKLTVEEMTGGTFTITNGGIFGSMLSTPILNPPQSAILGMHNIVQRPVAVNGEVVIRPIMYVALSYDHRIVDGKGAVSFLFKVKQMLEDPTRLLFGV